MKPQGPPGPVDWCRKERMLVVEAMPWTCILTDHCWDYTVGPEEDGPVRGLTPQTADPRTLNRRGIRQNQRAFGVLSLLLAAHPWGMSVPKPFKCPFISLVQPQDQGYKLLERLPISRLCPHTIPQQNYHLTKTAHFLLQLASWVPLLSHFGWASHPCCLPSSSLCFFP